MEPKILPGPIAESEAQAIHGSVTLPSSKSLTNRALVAAAVAGGGQIDRALDCEDTELLIRALRSAGWSIEGRTRVVIGQRRAPRGATAGEDGIEIHLGNSGTGARFILSLLAAVPGRFVVTGTSRLLERPMGPLLEALDQLGGDARPRVPGAGLLPVSIEGRQLAGGALEMRPDTSSQFVSSILLAAPLMRDGVQITLHGEVPSRPYLDLTEDVLRRFGAVVERDNGGRVWRVAGSGLRPAAIRIEGDWSAAAFFLGAAAVAGGSVELEPLDLESRQGDRAICAVLASCGVKVEQQRPGVVAVAGPATRPFDVDLRDTPDLFPVLAAVAASVPEGSRLTGLENLRHKESDRLGVMVEGLSRLGARFELEDETLTVTGRMPRARAAGRRVVAAGDHRIAMAMAVAALHAGPVELDDPACVGKSFREFWEAWERVVE